MADKEKWFKLLKYVKGQRKHMRDLLRCYMERGDVRSVDYCQVKIEVYGSVLNEMGRIYHSDTYPLKMEARAK